LPLKTKIYLCGWTKPKRFYVPFAPMPGLDLTEREREVLTLMIEGLNNTQIAGRLTVSPSTIKSHVSNILSKLGVASRTEAVTLALRHRIVP
jgi:NarL family two-component system response regulator LiaR